MSACPKSFTPGEFHLAALGSNTLAQSKKKHCARPHGQASLTLFIFRANSNSCEKALEIFLDRT